MRGLRSLPIAGILAFLLALGVVIYSAPMLMDALDAHGGFILPGVRAGSVELGGLNRRQAKQILQEQADYAGMDMTVLMPSGDLILHPGDTGAKLDIGAVVNAAYQYGRSGNTQTVELTPYLTLNSNAVQEAVKNYVGQLAAAETANAAALSGAVPALEESRFDASAACPDMVLTVGNTGYDVDSDALVQRILEAYADGSFRVDAEDLVRERPAEAFDLEAVQKQLGMAPVNAALDLSTGKVSPGSYGLSFDRDAAQELLKNAAKGESVAIPLAYEAPAILGQEVYFQDVLGCCETPHSNNEKRNTNLRLACEALNGIVLQPGDELSYNATLGKRTAEKGYQPAPAYSGTDLVDSLGGGICQVSSTLYLASLYAELETVDRINHGYPASYMPIGLDATVSWGNPDLKIRNDSAFPMKIIAEETEEYVRVWLMGTETRNHYVRMGFSSSGDGYSRSTVIRYDRATDEEIERIPHRFSSYLGSAWSVVGEIGMEDAYVGGNVKHQGPFQPSEEILKAAMNYSRPNRCQSEIG